ncbi:MAG: hypothetical protein QXK78_04655 [Candidatus Bathyarchaeia archaeon]
MRILNKAGFVAIFLAATLLVQFSCVAALDSTVKDVMLIFLSDVIGLDLTKYDVSKVSYSYMFPPYFGGYVKEEHITLDLSSSSGDVSVMSTFVNGFIWVLVVYGPTNGTVIYTRQMATNALDEARIILRNYLSFAEKYGLGTSHVNQALTLLDKVSTAPPNFGMRTFNNITGFVPSNITADNMKLETTWTGAKWIYIEDAVEMPFKCLSIDFGGNQIVFSDTWNLFHVGGLSKFSREEVLEIAWKAAKSYNLTVIGEGGTSIPVIPEWLDVPPEVTLNMVPGLFHRREIPDNFVNEGSAVRDPLALYPLWQVIFYFKKIGGMVGIAIGVWGDTGEIAYLTPYGYLGAPNINQTSPSETLPSMPENQNIPENNENPTLKYLPISIVAMIAIALVIITIVNRKNIIKRRRC